ncbi:MAG: GNAT family N-acetyltransferase [Promicromonosporaceae bacterium]|nr:GNAT family N-acetyltransferase [Promicromonosporaceae bacterium]
MTVHIDQAAAHEVPACAEIIATALLDDAVLRTFVRGDHHRHARLTDLHTAILRGGPLHGGAIDVARPHPGGPVIGVAAWEGPTSHTPWWTHVTELPRLLAAIGVRHLPASLRAQQTYHEARPEDPHWYLADITVTPAAQGLGVGSALLRHRLASIDAGAPLPAFLEATTPGSRRLYERYGFEPSGDIVVEGTVGTAMTRPACGELATA